MDKNTRWVVLAYVGLGILCAWVVGRGINSFFYYFGGYIGRGIGTLFNYLKMEVQVGVRDYEILGETVRLSHLLGVAIVAWIGAYLWRRKDINEASHEVVSELRKVTWPSRKETQTSTIVVIITTVFFSLILWFFDLVWSWATGLLYT